MRPGETIEAVELDRETVPVEAGAELVIRAASGDLAAYEALYRAEVGRVFALCWRLAGRRDVAEDLTQEVFLRAFVRLGELAEPKALASWLRRIAIRLVIDARRTEVRRGFELSGEDLPEPAVVARFDDALELDEAIRALPAGARAVFVLHDVEGFRHAEIAGFLGVTEGTSKAQLHRARTILRKGLQR